MNYVVITYIIRVPRAANTYINCKNEQTKREAGRRRRDSSLISHFLFPTSHSSMIFIK